MNRRTFIGRVIAGAAALLGIKTASAETPSEDPVLWSTWNTASFYLAEGCKVGIKRFGTVKYKQGGFSCNGVIPGWSWPAPGFIRESSRYTVSMDGLTLDWETKDVEE